MESCIGSKNGFYFLKRHGVLLTFIRKKPINAWWVYKIKFAIDKKLDKFKTCLMEKGYE
jgi:hypothetical protein